MKPHDKILVAPCMRCLLVFDKGRRLFPSCEAALTGHEVLGSEGPGDARLAGVQVPCVLSKQLKLLSYSMPIAQHLHHVHAGNAFIRPSTSSAASFGALKAQHSALQRCMQTQHVCLQVATYFPQSPWQDCPLSASLPGPWNCPALMLQRRRLATETCVGRGRKPLLRETSMQQPDLI